MLQKKKKNKIDNIPTHILDSISVRFLTDLDPNDLIKTERLFFILEEAHWFLIDNYQISYFTLQDFSSIILQHNEIKIDVKDAIHKFIKYRQSIKVYGAILFDKDLKKVLIVKESRKNKNYSFPKGKKSKDEEGLECAIREVYEEIGYDISSKIVNIPVNIFDKLTFYFVFNVDDSFQFKSCSANEILEIKWLPISKIVNKELDKSYTIITKSYSKWKYLYKALHNERFKFDQEPFINFIETNVVNQKLYK